MNQADLESAIDGAMSTILAENGYEVAWPNSQFTPSGKGYAKVDVIPATTWTASLQNKGVIYRGIYQVMLIIPLGSGVRKVQNDAHAIAEALRAKMFPDGENRVSGLPVGDTGEEVYLSALPSVGAGFYTDTGYNVPISFNYRADTTDGKAKANP